MFLSVVILGSFTTETHAMAHLITTDTPNGYLHHVTGRSPAGRPFDRVLCCYFLNASLIFSPASLTLDFVWSLLPS